MYQHPFNPSLERWKPVVTAPPIPFADADWAVLFERLAVLGGSPPAEAARQRLRRFAAHLLQWNRMDNLIGPAAEQNLLMRHLLDSATLLPFLDDNARVADLGSGGGLPGVVLAILSPPGRRFDLIERAAKKARFLKFIVHELGLAAQVRVLPVSADRLGRDGKNAYDLVVSRAVGSLTDGAAIAWPLLKPGGSYLALKGARHDRELDDYAASPVGGGYRPPTVHPDGLGEGVIIRLVRTAEAP